MLIAVLTTSSFERGEIMKRLIILLVAALSLNSCLTLDGNLTVRETLTVKKKSGLFGLGSKKTQVGPGAYRAKFDIVSKDSFVLQLVRDGEKDIRIPLKSDRNLNVPNGNGPIFISNRELNQEYDLAGDVRTDVDEYGYARGRESCTYTTVERHCRPVCTRSENGSQHCEKVCREETITHNGYQEVQYHYRKTFRALELDFLKGGSNARVAHFSGTDTQNEKIYDYKSSCY